MNVVSLTQHTADKDSTRKDQIAEIFLGMPWFPQEVDENPYSTGLAQFCEADATRLKAFFDCFCVEVPSTAQQEAILNAWDFLWKNYGRFIDLKLRGTFTFDALTRNWAKEQHAFLDALIAGSAARIKSLGTRNGFFEATQAILVSKSEEVPRRPTLKAVVPPAEATKSARGKHPATRQATARRSGKPALRVV